MGISANTIITFMDNSGITMLDNYSFIVSSENPTSMRIMEMIERLIPIEIKYYVIDASNKAIDLVKSDAYISLLPSTESIMFYKSSEHFQSEDSIFIIVLFDVESLYEDSFKYNNIFTFRFIFGDKDINVYDSSVFALGKYGITNYFLESSCAYQYLLSFDSFNEVQANDVLLSCMLGKVSIFSNYLSAPTALTLYKNGEYSLSYKLTITSTQLYHQIPNDDTFIICHWNSYNVVYNIINYVGFIKPDSTIYTMNMISDARTVIWILNSEYGGIMGNPISLTIIPYFDKNQSLYKTLQNYTNVVFFLTPYFEELQILEQEIRESGNSTDWKEVDNMLIAILDYTSGSFCNSVILSYGVSIHQILYPTLTSLALKTDSILLIGLPKTLAEGIVDTFLFYCEAYFLDCSTLVVEKFDLNNKTFFNSLNDYIKRNNTYIINGFFYKDCNIFLPRLINQLQNTTYIVNLVSLFLNRNVLNLFDIYTDNINHILFETVPSGTEQYLLEKYYKPAYTNDTIIPTVVHTWLAVYQFKRAAEYVVSMKVSTLYPKLLTLVNFREGQQKLDNIYSHFSRLVTFNRTNSSYDINYQIFFSLSNVYTLNYHDMYNKVYYTCAIKSYKSEEIISNIAIHLVLMSTIKNSREKGIVPRISQMVSIIEINQNSVLISGIQYISPIFMNVETVISNFEISELIFKIKKEHDITVSHIFGRNFDDIFLHDCNDDNRSDVYYKYPIIYWNPLFYSGKECLYNSMYIYIFVYIYIVFMLVYQLDNYFNIHYHICLLQNQLIFQLFIKIFLKLYHIMNWLYLLLLYIMQHFVLQSKYLIILHKMILNHRSLIL